MSITYMYVYVTQYIYTVHTGILLFIIMCYSALKFALLSLHKAIFAHVADCYDLIIDS